MGGEGFRLTVKVIWIGCLTDGVKFMCVGRTGFAGSPRLFFVYSCI